MTPEEKAKLGAEIWSGNKSDGFDPKLIYCGWCGKSQREVQKMIAGPPDSTICDECVDLCADIIKCERERERIAEKNGND